MRPQSLRQGLLAAAALWVLVAPLPVESVESEAPTDLTELSLEELAQLEVTTVSKRAERLATAAAAVHVITHEEIRRSGATTLAEALRLAPGVHVARIDSGQWAIGLRGFSSRVSRAVLVLIDGRSVYTPLFAGTYWEVQDTLLDDVDRIEVVRGPGGTLWGANAFNGVINVITRSAEATPGGLVKAGAGSMERAFGGLRHGGRAGRSGHYRWYAKGFDRGPAFHADGADYDDWSGGQAGFRMDLDLDPREELTVQGDVYSIDFGERVGYAAYEPPFSRIVDVGADLSGGNVLARWTRRQSSGAEMQLRGYYDRTSRREEYHTEDRDTFDLQFQHNLAVRGVHNLVWGIDWRVSTTDTGGQPTVAFEPPSGTDWLADAFIHDELSFRDGRVRLIAGTKLGYNNFSGFELQPNLRVAWSAAERHFLWAAASRAVRTPTRTDRDLMQTFAFSATEPLFARIIGSEGFDSEEVHTLETGYRTYPAERLFVDLTLFYNRYDDLFSLEEAAPFDEDGRTIFPFVIANGLEGDGYGAEIAAQASLTRGWDLAATYSSLRLDLEPEPTSSDTTQAEREDASPRHQVMLRSLADVTSRVQLDARLRYVGKLRADDVPSYTTLDLRLAWSPREELELALVGQTLLEARHAEFGSPASRRLIERGGYAKVTWRW